MLYTSDLIAQGSGSFNGLTFSHNRFGSYIRNRSTPVNPNTGRQQAARNNFGSSSGVWSATLTEPNREAWRLYGDSVVMQNALGQPIFLTGHNHFVRSTSAILQAGVPVVNPGPTTFTLPDTDPVFAGTISEATQLISVVFDDTLPWVSEDDAFMSIHMSQPRGVGRNFIGGPFRFAGVILGDVGAPLTSPQTIAVPFVATELQKVIVKARIGRADGRLSNSFQDSLDVAA